MKKQANQDAGFVVDEQALRQARAAVWKQQALFPWVLVPS